MKKNTLWLKVAAILTIGQIVNACSVSGIDCSAVCSNQPCSQSKNTWFPRAFSSDASREITLEKNLFQTESHRDEWNGTFSFATQYMQNFGAKCNSCKNLGSMFSWGAAGTNAMTVGNNGGTADIDMWNFGCGNAAGGTIPTTTGTPTGLNYDPNVISGTLTINPKITQVGTDFMLYFVHKKDEHGMYFKVHAPIGAISIDPQMTDTSERRDVNYFSQVTTGPANINYVTNYPSLANRAENVGASIAGGVGSNGTLDTMRQPYQTELHYGRISTCKQTEIRLADLSFVLGYNVFANEKGFFGLGFKTTCPTGNVPTARYALEPIFGRGGAWGVGADVVGHYKAWENDAKSKYLDVWFQGEVLHLLPGRTPSMRSFDLKANGLGSKYILLQHYHQEAASVATTANTTGFVAGSLTQAINITTLPVFSKFAAEGSASLMFDYHHNNWNLAVAGEFWGRTKETVSIDMCSCVDQHKENLNNFAVVGRQAGGSNPDATISTFASSTYTAVPSVIPLCEPAAKINKSQNAVQLTGTTAPFGFPASGAWPTGVVDGRVSTNRIPQDLNEALDICGAAAAKAFTGKVFAQFGYTWNDCRYTPNLSFIGSAEFTNNTNNAVQMWSAGLQGSLNF